MDDTNQLEVPPSFLALFTSRSGFRLLEPIATVRERYELCEDLAQVLTQEAATTLFQSGRTEREVLQRIQTALSEADSPVSPAEGTWVAFRLAELLNWPQPPDVALD